MKFLFRMFMISSIFDSFSRSEAYKTEEDNNRDAKIFLAALGLVFGVMAYGAELKILYMVLIWIPLFIIMSSILNLPLKLGSKNTQETGGAGISFFSAFVCAGLMVYWNTTWHWVAYVLGGIGVVLGLMMWVATALEAYNALESNTTKHQRFILLNKKATNIYFILAFICYINKWVKEGWVVFTIAIVSLTVNLIYKKFNGDKKQLWEKFVLAVVISSVFYISAQAVQRFWGNSQLAITLNVIGFVCCITYTFNSIYRYTRPIKEINSSKKYINNTIRSTAIQAEDGTITVIEDPNELKKLPLYAVFIPIILFLLSFMLQIAKTYFWACIAWSFTIMFTGWWIADFFKDKMSAKTAEALSGVFIVIGGLVVPGLFIFFCTTLLKAFAVLILGFAAVCIFNILFPKSKTD